MKWWIIIIACFAVGTARAQNGLWQIGTAIGYDYGVNFDPAGPYEAYASGRTSMVSFDVFLRIPISRYIGIYPTYIYSVPGRTMLVNNLNGEYLPNGYGFTLPYDDNNPSFWVSEEYPTLSSDAEIWQQSYGSFLTLMPVPGFELGTGLFVQNRRTDIYDYYAYDEYYYTGSTGTQFDHYAWWDTYEDFYPSRVTTYSSSRIAVPVLINMSGQWGFFQQGMSVIRWLGNDSYWTFRYTAGIAF